MCVRADGNSGVQCLLCGNRFASVKNMIKHQEKAHADEVRQHKERARAGGLCVCVCWGVNTHFFLPFLYSNEQFELQLPPNLISH